MVFVLFIISVIITVYTATKISQYADAISRLSGFGTLLIGTFLLASATSLPEVTTSVTAVFLDNPDMAVGNVMGSNLFNLAVLACFDMIYRRRRMLTNVHKQQRYTALFGIIMTLIISIALFYTIEIPFIKVGIESVLLILLYLLSIWVIKKATNIGKKKVDEEIKETSKKEEKYTLKGAIIGFIICAFVILLAGVLLTYAGDQIAIITGIGSSFVGSFLIATSTSLPEVVTVYTAIKLNNNNLAAASILGSNLFNLLILCLCDFLYPGSILQAASTVHITSSLFLLLSSILVGFGVYAVNRKRFYTWPSLIVVIVYALAMILLYLNG
ncbi:sodium:calcium antiporter [Alkalihalobacillus trypoxylicola]|uniref:Sodium/calcium exchanger membrane region domain-containing protein n=1 Tax=Alkalihalobacillus trypoxylicola TaxID=519424 RepID=A0A162CQC6_9BACI|nr:sodium:calcium antiporter [Alkalihalobacillus trypoxylicola]KYG26002.1 hypothetical protein AZF04_13020 [Alkalihalobacillus trypoxylicola]